MYDELNYAELDKMRDALLIEASGLTDRDEGKLQVIEDITTEMEDREAVASRRVLAAVACINILVLATILLVSGCQTLKGAMGDSAWLIQKGADNIKVDGE